MHWVDPDIYQVVLKWKHFCTITAILSSHPSALILQMSYTCISVYSHITSWILRIVRTWNSWFFSFAPCQHTVFWQTPRKSTLGESLKWTKKITHLESKPSGPEGFTRYLSTCLLNKGCGNCKRLVTLWRFKA